MSAHEEPLQPPVLSPPARRSRSWAPIVVTAAVVAIGLGVIGTSTSGGAGLYSYTLAQLAEAGTEAEGRDVKIAGRVAAGSVRGEPTSASFRFDIEDGAGHKLTIAYPRLLPDPFEEGRDAIVQGRITDGVLYASNLTVKCPSRYADTEQMTAEQQQKYYEKDYAKHKAAKADAAQPVQPLAAPR